MPTLIPAPHLKVEPEQQYVPTTEPNQAPPTLTTADALAKVIEIMGNQAATMKAMVGEKAEVPNDSDNEEKKRRSELAYNRKTLPKDLTPFDGRH